MAAFITNVTISLIVIIGMLVSNITPPGNLKNKVRDGFKVTSKFIMTQDWFESNSIDISLTNKIYDMGNPGGNTLNNFSALLLLNLL